MTTYSKEFRNNIISRMLPPTNESISTLARETQINEQTFETGETKPVNLGFQLLETIRCPNAGAVKINSSSFLKQQV